MNEQIDDGGPAWPCQITKLVDDDFGSRQRVAVSMPGMSLRDWFAGQALAGWFSCPETTTKNGFRDTAALCYEAADAMLAERQKGTK